MTFSEAVDLANQVGVIEEERFAFDDVVVLKLKDGSELRFKSEYDGPWSDVTPGMGAMPPTVQLYKNGEAIH